MASGTSEGAEKGWDARGRLEKLTEPGNRPPHPIEQGGVTSDGWISKDGTFYPKRFGETHARAAKRFGIAKEGTADYEADYEALGNGHVRVVLLKSGLYFHAEDSDANTRDLISRAIQNTPSAKSITVDFNTSVGKNGSSFDEVSPEGAVKLLHNRTLVSPTMQWHLHATGTSDGARKGWETRRGGGAAPAQAFVSPNVQEGTTLSDAHKMLDSQDHAKFKQDTEALVKKFIPGGSVVSSVGFWKDGAENSLVVAGKQAEAVRYVAAKMALERHQKGIVDFAVTPSGPDSRYRVLVPKNYTDEQIYASLEKHGIENGTIVRQGDQTEVRLLDFGSQLLDNVKAVAREYGSHIYKKAGQATWTGGETREEGAQALSAVVRDYEAKHGLRASGDRGYRRLELGHDRRRTATKEILAYGTSEGVKKEWDTRGRKAIEDKAIKEFGLTSNPREAGYILPDGRMLDFSGKNHGGDPNTRAYDHREISRVGPHMIQFERENHALRINVGSDDSLMVDIYADVPPTEQQMETLRGIVAKNRGGLFVDVYNKDGDLVHSVSEDLSKDFAHPSDVDDFVKRAIAAKDIHANRKLHSKIKFQGMNVSIENRKGSVRRGVDDAGQRWATTMKWPYGYIRTAHGESAMGVDGDHLDCFIGPDPIAPVAYIVSTKRPPDFKQDDEHKVMLGWRSAAAAKHAFMIHYDDHRFFGGMQAIPVRELMKKIRSSNGKAVLAEIGEPGVYDGGYGHIEPIPTWHSPSARKPKYVPNPSDPRETDDSLLDVTKRKDKAAAALRNRLTRQHTDQNMRPLNTQLVQGFPSVTIGGFG